MDAEKGLRKFCTRHCSGYCYPARGLALEINLMHDQMDLELYQDRIPATPARLAAQIESACRFIPVCKKPALLEDAIAQAQDYLIAPPIEPDEQFFDELFVS